ncbi:hypothetical protein Fcan01_10590 [Folsomia candida]|uniref:F-box domain-containing protein n=1 Tax=Folsomia candida TaxID=158441 RepID=A0A226EAT7_FOLCA|nr:hypothetical protein Fcan01_10590 [Folsomia candida]
MEVANHIVSRRSIHAEKNDEGSSFIEYYREPRPQKMRKISPQILEDQEPLDAEKETTSWRQTNPLLIANILDVIFPYLDHATLKTCCQVSSLWSVLATPLLRSRSQLHLAGPLLDERSDAFLSTISCSETLPMASLTYKVHTHTPFPLSDRAARFFAQFGPSLTSLTLEVRDMSKFSSKHYFTIVSHLVGRDCPSLTHLALTNLQYLRYEDPLDPAILNFTSPSIRHLTISFGDFILRPGTVFNYVAVFKSLLAIAPNATNLTTSCPDEGETFTLFLRTLRDSQISAQLNSFSLAGAPLDNVVMNILNSMNFQIVTSLEIDTKITVGTTEVVHFLEKLSPTLEKFVMFGDNWGVVADGGITMDFPFMPKLKVFKHQNFLGLRVASADFLKRLPKLGELVIRSWLTLSLRDMRRSVYGTMFHPREDIMGENSIYANLHVKKVVLDAAFVPTFENLGAIDKLLKMFPNVAELELTVSFAYKNICVGYVLETLAESKIRKLKIKFLKCAELSERVSASFRAALERYLPKFSELQRVDFILEDMPQISRFHLPLYVVEGMLCTKSLKVLNLTGFSIGKDREEETERCRQLLDDKLVEWKIFDSVLSNECPQ